MSTKLTAILGLAALLGAGTSLAASPQAGDWSRETRQLGNKVTIDVYQRTTPYALTGRSTSFSGTPSGEWTRQTRQLGNKVTYDAFVR